MAEFYYEYIKSTDSYLVGSKDETLSGEVKIPTYYNGKSVTGIAEGGFKKLKNITSIKTTYDVTTIDFSGGIYNPVTRTYSVTANLKSIGKEAFFDCTALESIELPASLEEIGEYAFMRCSSLKSFDASKTALKTMSSIGTFSGCSSLTSIVFSDVCENFFLYGGRALKSDDSLYGCNNLTSVKFGKSVNQYDYNGSAFVHCPNLKEVLVSSGNSYYASIDGNLVRTFTNGNEKYIAVGVTSAIIRDGISYIYPYAFAGRNVKQSITIPNSVYGIGDGVFQDCTTLETISIGSGVASIGDNPFGGCKNLGSIEVSSSNSTYHSSGNCCIKTSENKLVFGCKNSVIPNYVTEIGKKAFYYASNLSEILIPESVNIISTYAFAGCSGLVSKISIPDSVTTIGGGAFYDCTNLPCVEIFGEEVVLGASVFNSCKNLESCVLPSKTSSIPYRGFYNCEKLLSIDIPDSVTKIGESAFESCKSLNSIVIPDSVTTISLMSFCGCTALENVVLSQNVTEIPIKAFYECLSLRSIFIPNGVTQIGWSAFEGCENIESIDIPDSTVSIGYFAFRNCTNLDSVEIGSSLNSLEFCAFENCVNLSFFKFNGDAIAEPASTREWVFGNTEKLNSVSVNINASGWGNTWCGKPISFESNMLVFTPTTDYAEFSVKPKNNDIPGYLSIPSQCNNKSVSIIEDYAFENCVNITQVHIPDSITYIGTCSFRGCLNISKIEVSSSNLKYKSENNCCIESDNKKLLFGCNNSVIPSSVLSIEDYAFYSLDKISSINIPESVESVGNYSFSKCASLKEVTVSGSVKKIGDYSFSDCGVLSYFKFDGNVIEDGISVFENNISLEKVLVNPSSIGWGDTFGGCDVFIDSDVFLFIKNENGNSYSIQAKDKNISGSVNIDATCLGKPVTTLGEESFSGCSKITSVNIPSSVTIIEKTAFNGCSGLETITVDQGNSVYYSSGNCCVMSEKNILIFGCKNSVIPDTVRSIGSLAFKDCTELNTITFPRSITNIGNSSFLNCSGLESIVIPGSISTIGYSAFENCVKLSSFKLEGNYIEESSDTLRNTPNLSSVNVSKSAVGFGDTWNGKAVVIDSQDIDPEPEPEPDPDPEPEPEPDPDPEPDPELKPAYVLANGKTKVSYTLPCSASEISITFKTNAKSVGWTKPIGSDFMSVEKWVSDGEAGAERSFTATFVFSENTETASRSIVVGTFVSNAGFDYSFISNATITVTQDALKQDEGGDNPDMQDDDSWEFLDSDHGTKSNYSKELKDTKLLLHSEFIKDLESTGGNFDSFYSIFIQKKPGASGSERISSTLTGGYKTDSDIVSIINNDVFNNKTNTVSLLNRLNTEIVNEDYLLFNTNRDSVTNGGNFLYSSYYWIAILYKYSHEDENYNNTTTKNTDAYSNGVLKSNYIEETTTSGNKTYYKIAFLGTVSTFRRLHAYVSTFLYFDLAPFNVCARFGQSNYEVDNRTIVNEYNKQALGHFHATRIDETDESVKNNGDYNYIPNNSEYVLNAAQENFNDADYFISGNSDAAETILDNSVLEILDENIRAGNTKYNERTSKNHEGEDQKYDDEYYPVLISSKSGTEKIDVEKDESATKYSVKLVLNVARSSKELEIGLKFTTNSKGVVSWGDGYSQKIASLNGVVKKHTYGSDTTDEVLVEITGCTKLWINDFEGNVRIISCYINDPNVVDHDFDDEKTSRNQYVEKLYIKNSGIKRLRLNWFPKLIIFKDNIETNTGLSKITSQEYLGSENTNLLREYTESRLYGITDLTRTFCGWKKDTAFSLNVDFNNVSTFLECFKDCSSLTSITVTDIKPNTTGVKSSFQSMFEGCSNISYVNIPTKKGEVTNSNAMFKNCVNMNTFIFGDVTNIVPFTYSSSADEMFYGCREMSTIVFDKSYPTSMDGTFNGSGLIEFTYIDDANKSTIYRDCFRNTPIETLKLNLEKATNIRNMIKDSSKIKKLHLKNLTIPVSFEEGSDEIIVSNNFDKYSVGISENALTDSVRRQEEGSTEEEDLLLTYKLDSMKLSPYLKIGDFKQDFLNKLIYMVYNGQTSVDPDKYCVADFSKVTEQCLKNILTGTGWTLYENSKINNLSYINFSANGCRTGVNYNTELLTDAYQNWELGESDDNLLIRNDGENSGYYMAAYDLAPKLSSGIVYNLDSYPGINLAESKYSLYKNYGLIDMFWEGSYNKDYSNGASTRFIIKPNKKGDFVIMFVCGILPTSGYKGKTPSSDTNILIDPSDIDCTDIHFTSIDDGNYPRFEIEKNEFKTKINENKSCSFVADDFVLCKCYITAESDNATLKIVVSGEYLINGIVIGEKNDF